MGNTIAMNKDGFALKVVAMLIVVVEEELAIIVVFVGEMWLTFIVVMLEDIAWFVLSP